MTPTTTNIADLIRHIANPTAGISFSVIPGVVTDIDKVENTCTVTPFDDSPYTDVLLTLSDERGCVVYPVEDSIVGISRFDADTTCVVMYSEIESYSMLTEDDSLKEILVELLNQILLSKYMTNTGATLQLVNDPQFRQIQQRIEKFFER